MNALQMPPLAVMIDDTGVQTLVVPLGMTELLPGLGMIELATIWAAKQSTN